MEAKFKHPESIFKMSSHFCPGCGHGIVHRLVADVIDSMNCRGKTVGIVGVGCSSRSWRLFDCDFLAVPHGRCGPAATAMKRSQPDHLVFSYGGDGDSYAIGMSGLTWSAIRGESYTAIVVNNTLFAMTGGQMAPTCLPGQVTVTSPKGRDVADTGAPLHYPEMMQNMPGVAYAARVSVDTVPNILKAGKAIAKAFEKQRDKKGFSLVEVLASCPTGMNMKPVDAMRWVGDKLMAEFPLGEFVDR